jgi:hypothetical protein
MQASLGDPSLGDAGFLNGHVGLPATEKSDDSHAEIGSVAHIQPIDGGAA